jgi:hypothetical protein
MSRLRTVAFTDHTMAIFNTTLLDIPVNHAKVLN